MSFQIVDLKGLKEDFDPAKQVEKIMSSFHGTAAGLAFFFLVHQHAPWFVFVHSLGDAHVPWN